MALWVEKTKTLPLNKRWLTFSKKQASFGYFWGKRKHIYLESETFFRKRFRIQCWKDAYIFLAYKRTIPLQNHTSIRYMKGGGKNGNSWIDYRDNNFSILSESIYGIHSGTTNFGWSYCFNPGCRVGTSSNGNVLKIVWRAERCDLILTLSIR